MQWRNIDGHRINDRIFAFSKSTGTSWQLCSIVTAAYTTHWSEGNGCRILDSYLCCKLLISMNEFLLIQHNSIQSLAMTYVLLKLLFELGNSNNAVRLVTTEYGGETGFLLLVRWYRSTEALSFVQSPDRFCRFHEKGTLCREKNYSQRKLKSWIKSWIKGNQ